MSIAPTDDELAWRVQFLPRKLALPEISIPGPDFASANTQGGGPLNVFCATDRAATLMPSRPSTRDSVVGTTVLAVTTASLEVASTVRVTARGPGRFALKTCVPRATRDAVSDASDRMAAIAAASAAVWRVVRSLLARE